MKTKLLQIMASGATDEQKAREIISLAELQDRPKRDDPDSGRIGGIP
ncbi:MAG TPA: hypothetical protein VK675_02915 [Candidatus Paceibacterota bacterium]|nr:hypothetical protein [Candidatus Paceibacterota bacterium]